MKKKMKNYLEEKLTLKKIMKMILMKMKTIKIKLKFNYLMQDSKITLKTKDRK
jgi:hypothetical protein